MVGGGLAGSEAAWQLAERGHNVRLFELRPGLSTGAHTTQQLAELVCSNSLGSQLPDRAPGVLLAALDHMGSMLIQCARATEVPISVHRWGRTSGPGRWWPVRSTTPWLRTRRWFPQINTWSAV